MVTRRLLVVANEAPTVYVIRATNRCWKNVGTSLPFTTSSSQKQNTRIPIKRVVVQQIFANNGVSDAEATHRVDPCVRSARCVDGATTSRCSQTTVASIKKWRSRNFKSPSLSFLDRINYHRPQTRIVTHRRLLQSVYNDTPTPLRPCSTSTDLELQHDALPTPAIKARRWSAKNCTPISWR